jgi:hypothetical protein
MTSTWRTPWHASFGSHHDHDPDLDAECMTLNLLLTPGLVPWSAMSVLLGKNIACFCNLHNR